MHAVYERFAAVFVELSRQSQGRVHPLSPDAALILVSGMRELVTVAVDHGRDVREVRPAALDVITAVLRPR